MRYSVLSVALWFAFELLQSYCKDPQATYIVDNRQLWFVPVVNLDGLSLQRKTNPSGGGIWRKNRRLNEGGSYGVDINRNYAYQWGFDDVGSSPSGDIKGNRCGSECQTDGFTPFVLCLFRSAREEPAE